MSKFLCLLVKVLSLSALLLSGWVSAQEVIKIGVVGPLTGPFAIAGQAYKQGVEAYMAINGVAAGGRKVEAIFRDSAGSDPSLAKRLAEELVVKDKVSILIGFYLTPEAASAAQVATESKTPLLLVNAASPALIDMSPYFLRLGMTMNQPANLGATYARQQGKSRGYTAVADYSPGHQIEQYFSQSFTAEGGTMVGSARIPLNTTDFAPLAERIANANPDVIQMFVPPGATAIGLIKALAARGLTKKILIIGQAEADDSDLSQFDDSIIGFHTIQYVDTYADNAENKAFGEWLRKNVGPLSRPNPFNVGAYDSTAVAYKMISDQAGKPFNGDAAMKSVVNWAFKGPRGTVVLNTNRQLTQNFYVREVIKGSDGVKKNRVVKTWENVTTVTVK